MPHIHATIVHALLCILQLPKVAWCVIQAVKHVPHAIMAVQVIDYYHAKVVKLEADKQLEQVSQQIRTALSKIKRSDD